VLVIQEVVFGYVQGVPKMLQVIPTLPVLLPGRYSIITGKDWLFNVSIGYLPPEMTQESCYPSDFFLTQMQFVEAI